MNGYPYLTGGDTALKHVSGNEYTYVTNKHIDLEWRYFLRYGREI